MKLLRWIAFLIFLAFSVLIGGALLAQTTTYTGTIKDLSAAAVTSGQVTFTLTPSVDSTTSGSSRFVPTTVTCPINTDGTFSLQTGAACAVQQNTALSPTGTGYKICIQPYFASPGSCFYDYAVGATKDISTVAPTLQTGPLNYSGIPGPPGVQGIQGPQGLAGSVSASGAVGTVQVAAGSGAMKPSDSSTILNTLPIQEYQNTARPWNATFQNALDNCQNQPVNILYLWDSRGIVDNAIARTGNNDLALTLDIPREQRHAELLRKDLQGSCPSHGTGLVPLIFGIPVALVNPNYWTISGAVTTTNVLGPYNSTGIVYGGTVVLASGETATFAHPDIPWSTLRLYCATSSSSTGMTVTIDGVSAGTACGGTSTNPTAVLWTAPSVPRGLHTVAITSVGGGSVLYGAEGVDSPVGVSLYNGSVGSAPMEFFSQFPATQFAFTDLIPGGHQLVITNMLTNEPGNGISTAQYQTSLTNLITHERSLPSAPSILLFSPMQDGISGQAPFYPIMAAVAKANNTGFVDMRDRVGSAINTAFFGPDTYHENVLGNAMEYEAIKATISTIPTLPLAGGQCSLQGPGYVLTGFDAHNQPVCSAPETLRVAGGCGAGYGFSVPINIAHAKVQENAVQFPVFLPFNGDSPNSLTLAALKTAANGGKVLSTVGLDIIFCDKAQGGNQLAHELVTGSYVPTSGAAQFHVRVPRLSTTADTTIWMFYGQDGAVDSSRPADVWSNGYAAVYHFGGFGSTTFFTDSTRNGNTLAVYGASGSTGATPGEYGIFAYLNATGTLANTAPLGLSVNEDARTVEEWFKMTAVPTGSAVNFLPGYGDYNAEANYGVLMSATNLLIQTLGGAVQSAFVPDTTTWHFLATSLPQGGLAPSNLLFLDGVSQALTCPTTCAASYKTQRNFLNLNGYLGGGNLTLTGALDVDEVRFSNVQRSAGWLSTQYANFTNPSTFAVLGAAAGVTQTNNPTLLLDTSNGHTYRLVSTGGALSLQVVN